MPINHVNPLLYMQANLQQYQSEGILQGPQLEIITPSVEVIGMPMDGEAIMRHLEGAIRTAYKSEDKIGPDSHIKILKHILSLKHESTLEHVSMSFRIITNRGVSHELVRHRLASYTQESTRYVSYAKKAPKLILPWHLIDRAQQEKTFWFMSHINILGFYLKAVEDLKWKPQDARGFLPNDIKTEVVMTMNLRSLRNFLMLRTAAAAHPDMQVIAREILRIMYELVPLLFEDIQGRLAA